MKKWLLICFFLSTFISLSTYSQSVSYYYDDAGNRIERVISLKSAKITSDQSSQNQDLVEDIFLEHEIKIYPNPTEGKLSVNIENAQKLEGGEVIITGINGEVLIQKKITTSLMHFDLSGKSAGLYLMKIRFNGELTTWKIIKQ
ncbi:MAG: T9SS type A sorting domain-containing protein [Draconibacterium sp.]